MEHGLQHQSALNRGVRVDPGCAWSAAKLRISPPRDGVFIKPERQSASRYESPIVIAPISDTIPEYIVIFCHGLIVPTQQLFWNSATMPRSTTRQHVKLLLDTDRIFPDTAHYKEISEKCHESLGFLG